MSDTPTLQRRALLIGAASGLGLVAMGCRPKDAPEGLDSASRDSGAPDSEAPDSGDSGAVEGWASGGADALAEDYAVSFDEGCALTCFLGRGPCYNESPERRDITEGLQGLPTRLSLRITNTDCEPVVGAVVDIWHCSPDGFYSGEEAAARCTRDNPEAMASLWCRGTQTSDAEGRVDFDTVMPGWYPGRAVHVHVLIFIGRELFSTTQFGMPGELLDDIYANHPLYAVHGPPDTRNGADNIFRQDPEGHLFQWRRADDGALVLWQSVVIKASPAEEDC